MLTVSLHGVQLHAPHGLYEQEHVLGNDFEIDVDIFIPVDNNAGWPFVDYAIIHGIALRVFHEHGQLLETFVQHIHAAIKMNVPQAQKVKVAVRKLHPPLTGTVRYAQVQYEG